MAKADWPRSIFTAPMTRTEFIYDANGNALTEKRWDSTRGAYSGGLTGSNASITQRAFLARGAISQITDPRNVVTAFDIRLRRAERIFTPMR